MRRGQKVVPALLAACLTLAGCGQPLVGIEESNAPQTVGSATPGVPNDAPAGPAFETTPGPAADGSIVAELPESSAPPVDNVNPPPAADASLPPAPAEPTPEPTIDPTFNDVRLPGAEDRWRYVQVERTPLPTVQTYNSSSREILWWYDPRLGQAVKLGEIQGDFPVQATFRFRGQEVDALEVPYQINQSFGITLPAATVDQIRQAGYTGEWIEAFVYKDGDIQPR